jgi:glycosyltransferase involved in cell wall biosynthesis
MTETCVAVLGRRDEPTDAVEEYCQYLAAGLAKRRITLELARVAWAEKGWGAAQAEFLASYAARKNRWFLLQYTALGWSQRGFPWRFLGLLKRLKKDGARCAVVFHDMETYPGERLVDRVRKWVQLHAMRKAARLAEVTILTVPREKIPWLDATTANAVFIPVGANLPEPEKAWPKPGVKEGAPPAVAVFAITGGDKGKEEAQAIADAALFASAQIGPLRVVLLGRNSDSAKTYLDERFRGTRVRIEVLGLLPAEKVVEALGACDVLLFVRAPISSRRGSAIAGIACGLPVIAQEGWETAAPITLAGIAFIPAGEKREWGPALLRVLTDTEYRAALAARSRAAQTQYFSWDAIASQYLAIFEKFKT